MSLKLWSWWSNISKTFRLMILTAFYLNPLTPGAFCQKRIFWTFWRFSGLDMGQISSNLLKKAFATWQHALLSTSITFLWHFCSGMRRNQNFVFRLFHFFFSTFLFLLFFSFCCSDWPSTGLASSLKHFEKSSSRQAIFAME